MRFASLALIAALCAACAQNSAPETTAAIVTPTPTVVVVEKPVVVEKTVIVEKPVIVEKRVPVYVEKRTVSKASGSGCHYVHAQEWDEGLWAYSVSAVGAADVVRLLHGN